MAELTRTPLKKGYLLEGYRIERLIGGGGFSLVYLAYQVRTKHLVVIKEFFPGELVERLPGGKVVARTEEDAKQRSFNMGIKRFFDEANALSAVKHPNIVSVSNFFRYNGTAYMVMDYAQGRDLRWFIKRSAGRLGSQFMWTVFPQVALGLRELHRNGFLHLDIKPANILLRAGGRPLLIDFGAVQQPAMGERFQGIQTLTHGFAAPEQYNNGLMGPWSDIYALGATLYGAITGEPPPPGNERLESDEIKLVTKQYSRRYNKQLLSSIEWALQVDHHYRPQSVDTFLRMVLEEAPPELLLPYADQIQGLIPSRAVNKSS